MDDTLLGIEAAFPISIPTQREALQVLTTFDDVLDEMHRMTTAQREALMNALRWIDRPVCETLVVALMSQAFDRVVDRRLKGYVK